MGDAKALHWPWGWRFGAPALVISLGLASFALERRDAVILAADVEPGSIVVLFAGASDADRRLEALHALCMHRAEPMWLLVGDDDELDDATGRAWGPLLAERVRTGFPECFDVRLVPGRVRTTAEELSALDAYVRDERVPPGATLLLVTSPYHRARVELAFARHPGLARHAHRFLFVAGTLSDRAPHTTVAEGLRLLRDALGLSELFGRRSLDRLREYTPWQRPTGVR